ncbi:MAG: hypothetical protein WAW30_03475 [Patescibacteria group bacterium]
MRVYNSLQPLTVNTFVGITYIRTLVRLVESNYIIRGLDSYHSISDEFEGLLPMVASFT